jgi:hypothetical protein
MTEQERKEKEQEEKDRYRFSGYHWVDSGKSESNNLKDDVLVAPTIITKPEPAWWGKKALSTQPL